MAWRVPLYVRKRGQCRSLLTKETNTHEKTAAELPKKRKFEAFIGFGGLKLLTYTIEKS